MKLHRVVFPSVVLAACLVAPGSDAHATLLVGNLAIAGSGSVAVTSNGVNYVIDFQPPVNTDGKGTGAVSIVGGSTGSFAGLTGTQATIKDLNDADVPVGVPVNLPDFLTFSAPSASQWTITLTKLLTGSYGSADCLSAPAAGQNCTVGLPGVKEFNWSNITDHSSIVSASFEGIATDKATGETSKINGTLGATFSDKPFQTILSEAIEGRHYYDLILGHDNRGSRASDQLVDALGRPGSSRSYGETQDAQLILRS
jgi:hypothetical protein